MRSQFPGYYRPTEPALDELWATAHFAMDANVLLNLYRVGSDAARAFLDVIEGLGDRVWVPHQAAHEYQENRLNVLHTRATMVSDLESEVDRLGSQLVQKLQAARRHPGLDHEHLVDLAETMLQEARQYLSERRDAEPEVFSEDIFGRDWIFDRLSDLLEGRVGDAYSDAEIRAVHVEGKRRFDSLIPPGYEDARKDEPERYGDFVLWRQVLDYAKTSSLPIILVTEEEKDDWWRRFNGRRIGPRPELVAEVARAAGVGFYLYSSASFIEHVQRQLRTQVPDAAIGELGKGSERARQSDKAKTDLPEPRAEEGYRGPAVCAITGVTYRQLDHWTRTGLITPSVQQARGSGHQHRFSYGDLIEIKVITSMLDAGLSLQAVRRCIDSLKDSLSGDLSSSSLVITPDGSMTVAEDSDALVDILRQPQTTVSAIVSLSGVVEDVDEAIRSLWGDPPRPNGTSS